MIGHEIGPYRVISLLGAGGMGEVYRARDTRLGRDVAIKVLPEAFASDPDRLSRFEREARMLASLNHPHIASIYGFEESGGVRALVLELVEGQTVGELAGKEGIALRDALTIASQIAEALEAAHARGIIHRDLKPANVKVTPGGAVKVLDFGLAKAWTEESDQSLSQPPTVTATVAHEGALLGTAAYMSPEQARGRAVDMRTDVWAFGCVLYEMLSGRRAFPGDTLSDTLASILEREPDWKALPSATPARIRDLLRRCLQKDADKRLRDLGDARRDIDATLASPFKVPRAVFESLRWTASRTGVRLAVAAVVIAIVVALTYRMRDVPSPLPQLVNPVQVTSAIGVEDYPTMSPDGRTIAYESNQAGRWDIWLSQIGGGASVNRTDARRGHNRYPSWSPDGRQLAFWSDEEGGGYYVMPTLGGAAARMASAPFADHLRSSAEWSPDGSQLAFVNYKPVGGKFEAALDILTIATRDMKRVVIPGTQESRLDLSWSHDGRFIAYLDIAQQPAETSQVMVLRLSNGAAAPVTDAQLNSRSPRWSADDRSLFFVSNQASTWDLWRQPLDVDKRPRGGKERVTTGLDMLHVAFSQDGNRLLYAKGRWVSNAFRVLIRNDRPATWADVEQLTFDQAFIEFVNVSADGQWLAYSSDRMGNQDLWKMRLDGKREAIRLTTSAALEWDPNFSPDGKQLAFYSNRTGNREIWIMAADGGPARQLTDTRTSLNAGGPWSPDGTEIAYRSERLGSSDVWVTSADGQRSRVIAGGPSADYGHAWSPDGKWMAFFSNRNGLLQLFKVPAAGGEPERLNDGDTGAPVWSLDGKDIFYSGRRERAGDFWAWSIATRKERRVTDFAGRRGALVTQPPSTDGWLRARPPQALRAWLL